MQAVMGGWEKTTLWGISSTLCGYNRIIHSDKLQIQLTSAVLNDR